MRTGSPWGIATELRTANLLLKELNSSRLKIRNLADTAFKDLQLSGAHLLVVQGAGDDVYLDTYPSQNAVIYLRSHDGAARVLLATMGKNGLDLAKARLTGAMDCNNKLLTNFSPYSQGLLYLATPLSVAIFQEQAATGNAVSPQYANDNNTGTFTAINPATYYVEIDFGYAYRIDEFRYYGHASHNQDGTWKIQYWDGSAWQDLNTGLVTRLASWSAWIALSSVVVTTKVRFVSQTIDTGVGNYLSELEMRGKNTV